MVDDDLSRLAAKYGTDKFGHHCYTPVYHRLLRHYRDRKLKVLEIGVGGYGDQTRGGQSLAMWRDYFPDAAIVGIDIQEKAFDLGPRVTILRGSQVDPEFLAEVLRDHGPFDIIIDDGSHQNAHVIESFRLLYPTLAEGGTYVVEDVQTSFVPARGGSIALTQPNSVGFFRELFADPDRDPAFDIARLSRFHNMVAIRKPPVQPGRTGDGSFAEAAVALAPGSGRADWRQTFSGLAEDQALALTGPAEAAALPELLTLFVDLDHREIAVHHPGHAPDALCRDVLCVERDRTGVYVVKGRNDYPSNFQFEPDHPEVLEVRAAIERQLATDPAEGGLLGYANLVAHLFGWAAARPYVDALEKRGWTSPAFFRIATAVAKADGDKARARDLFERGVAEDPHNPELLMGLANACMAAGETARAIDLAERTLVAAPKSGPTMLAAAQIYLRAKDTDRAIALGRQALPRMPKHKRHQVDELLASALARRGDYAAALAQIRLQLDSEGPRQGKFLWLASAFHRHAGDAAEALETAERALACDPGSARMESWLQSVRTWAKGQADQGTGDVAATASEGGP